MSEPIASRDSEQSIGGPENFGELKIKIKTAGEKPESFASLIIGELNSLESAKAAGRLDSQELFRQYGSGTDLVELSRDMLVRVRGVEGRFSHWKIFFQSILGV